MNPGDIDQRQDPESIPNTSFPQMSTHGHEHGSLHEDLLLDPALREFSGMGPRTVEVITPQVVCDESEGGNTQADLSPGDVNRNSGIADDAGISKGDGRTEKPTSPMKLGRSLLGRTTDPTQMLDIQRKLATRFAQKKPSTAAEHPRDLSEEIIIPEIIVHKTVNRQVSHGVNRSDGRAFDEIRRIYLEKKRAGTLTMEEDIEFMRTEASENARLRKIETDQEHDRTPTPTPEPPHAALFVPSPTWRNLVSEAEEHDAGSEPEPEPEPKKTKPAGRKRKNKKEHDSETEPEHESRPEPKKSAGRKRKNNKAHDSDMEPEPKNIAGRKRKNDDHNDDDDEPGPSKGQRKRRRTNAGGRAKGRKPSGWDYTDGDVEDILAAAKARIASGKQKKSLPDKPKKGKGKPKNPTMTNTNRMLGTDVFNDATEAATRHTQPTFAANTRRDQALKELIASVPIESDYDMRNANSDMKYLNKAMADFDGHGAVKPADDGLWSVRGMKTTLKSYQILGVAFMRRRERGSDLPKGGILADQMGLGKTITMLCNIVNGKPSKDAKVRATLIVAAPAICRQWKNEIARHCESKKNHGLDSIMEYKPGSRLQGSNSVEILQKADIVLTTYHEVARSFPKAIFPPNLVTAKQKDEWWRDHYEREKDLLHQCQFYRIVLDEAQAIKNHLGHTSRACRAITAEHHWAITGTPIMNGIKEFYPYFKFLHEPTTGSYRLFKDNFCTPDDPDGLDRLNVFLQKFMIRRTHADTLFNARLLDLPNPVETTVWLDLNTVERQIYEIVKNRMLQRINALSKSPNGVEKHYSQVFTLLLRLRQLCSHILLIQDTIVDLLEREDFEKLNKITEDEGEQTTEGCDLLLHLREVITASIGKNSVNGGQRNATSNSTATISSGSTNAAESRNSTDSRHRQNFRFRKYLDNLLQSDNWDSIVNRNRCCFCQQPPLDPQVTSCFHIYCRTCLISTQSQAARHGHDEARCIGCGDVYTSTRPVQERDHTREDSGSKSSSEVSSATAVKSKPKNEPKKKSKSNEMDDWIAMRGAVLPSAKTQAVKAQLMVWFQHDSTLKVIIFTQFLPVVRILMKVCRDEGWGCCKYTGEMSQDARSEAIEDFENKDHIRVMISSLRCGGLGLNLTMASKVICMDPWWNIAVEQQAFCRVYRIGQTRETEMTRLVCRNTIDSAMMNMKEKKQNEIDGVMDSANRTSTSVRELLRLFGDVEDDAEGRPHIFPAPVGDEPDHYRLPVRDEDEDEYAMMGNEA